MPYTRADNGFPVLIKQSNFHFTKRKKKIELDS